MRAPAKGIFTMAELREGLRLSIRLRVGGLVGWCPLGGGGLWGDMHISPTQRVLHSCEWHSLLLGGRWSPSVWLRGPHSGGMGGGSLGMEA